MIMDILKRIEEAKALNDWDMVSWLTDAVDTTIELDCAYMGDIELLSLEGIQ